MPEPLEVMLQHAAREVFDTMLNMKVSFAPSDTQIGSQPYVAGTIGFTGKFHALIQLYTNLDFARKMTSHLLGMPENMLDGHEMINDAIGELTNMHAGYIKSRLCDQGVPCSITFPTVVNGTDFSIVPVSGSTKRAICVCSHPKETVLLELIVKPE